MILLCVIKPDKTWLRRFASPRPVGAPINPPITPINAVSVRKIVKTVLFFAPMAFNNSISQRGALEATDVKKISTMRKMLSTCRMKVNGTRNTDLIGWKQGFDVFCDSFREFWAGNFDKD